jgi:hypothetical protein
MIPGAFASAYANGNGPEVKAGAGPPLDTIARMTDVGRKTLPCGCEVDTARDFLGRVVGKVITKGANCPQALHVPGHVVVMPGREHARPE